MRRKQERHFDSYPYKLRRLNTHIFTEKIRRKSHASTKFSDVELFDKDPAEWFRQHNPEWNDEQIQYAVNIIKRGEIVELYEKLEAQTQ